MMYKCYVIVTYIGGFTSMQYIHHNPVLYRLCNLLHSKAL